MNKSEQYINILLESFIFFLLALNILSKQCPYFSDATHRKGLLSTSIKHTFHGIISNVLKQKLYTKKNGEVNNDTRCYFHLSNPRRIRLQILFLINEVPEYAIPLKEQAPFYAVRALINRDLKLFGKKYKKNISFAGA